MSFAKKYFFTLLTIIVIIFLGRKSTSAGSTTSGSAISNLNNNLNQNSKIIPPESSPSLALKDGSYTGQSADAYYGPLQVQITVNGGKISNINFLQYPSDNGRSARISSQALPKLKSEVISSQSSQVNAVSGASFTSSAFLTSLNSAISQASK